MTPDIQFLINCSKSNPEAVDIEKIRKHASRLDSTALSAIAALARSHGVFPLLYQAIQSHAVDLIPEESLADLKQGNLNLVVQNMYMASELIRILKLLKDNGIQALAFKGPALSELAYADITLRQYCDLDILIKKQDIAKSIHLLTQDQYIPEIELPEEAGKTFFSCVNVIGLSKIIHIEIHWELLSKNYAIDWPEEALWKQHNAISMDGSTVPMLAYNTHLLYICAHGAKHLFQRLEWVCDIDRLIRTGVNTSPAGLDWPGLFKDAQTLGIERILLLGLYLSQKLLALPLPEDIRTKVLYDPAVEKLAQHIISLHFSTPNNQSRSYGTFGLLWNMRENLSDRLRFAYRALFAPKLDDFKYVQLPANLMFLYPVIRPFRLLTKYFRKK